MGSLASVNLSKRLQLLITRLSSSAAPWMDSSSSESSSSQSSVPAPQGGRPLLLRIRPRAFHQPALLLQIFHCSPELAEVLDREGVSIFERFLGSGSLGPRVLLHLSEGDWCRLGRASRESQICLHNALFLQR